MPEEHVTQVTADNLDLVQEQAQRRSAAARQAAAGVQDIRAMGRSDKGVVSVTVDGSALVVDMEFSLGASSSPATLGPAVKQAHDRAVDEWNRQVKEVAAAALPDEPDIAEMMSGAADAEMPAHVEREDGSDR